MGQYLPIVVLAALAIVFGVLSLLASVLLAPRWPNDAKSAPYECGIVPAKEPPERFPVSFYVIAMLFIMFDIEIIFAYPYALESRAFGTYGLVEMLSFSAVFFVAFVFAVARGALDWGPAKREAVVAPIAAQPVAGVRVVGLEGREEAATWA